MTFHKIPALDRGLILLEKLITSKSPLRYIDLKGTLEGITDASLNRLLKSLMASEMIQKNKSGHYEISSKVHHWGNFLKEEQNLSRVLENAVSDVNKETNESVAFVIQRENYLQVLESYTQPEGVTVIQKDQILDCSSDHAAVLSILKELGTEDKMEMIYNRFHSRIKNMSELQISLNQYDKIDYVEDAATSRPGISRLAIPVKGPNYFGSLFLCLTTERMNRDRGYLVAAIKKGKKYIESFNLPFAA